MNNITTYLQRFLVVGLNLCQIGQNYANYRSRPMKNVVHGLPPFVQLKRNVAMPTMTFFRSSAAICEPALLELYNPTAEWLERVSDVQRTLARFPSEVRHSRTQRRFVI